jgi:hypothetical protein
VAKSGSPAAYLKAKPSLLVLFAVGFCSLGVYLLLLVSLLCERFLILLCALVLMLVVRFRVRLREPERRCADENCEQDEIQASSLHGFPAEVVWRNGTPSRDQTGAPVCDAAHWRSLELEKLRTGDVPAIYFIAPGGSAGHLDANAAFDGTRRAGSTAPTTTAATVFVRCDLA